VASRRHLCYDRHGSSSTQSQLLRALALGIAGQTVCNSLSDDLRDPTLSIDSFRRLPKSLLLFSEYYSMRITGIALYAVYKFTTFLLTYLNSDRRPIYRA